MDKINELKILTHRLENGEITQDYFNSAKRKIIESKDEKEIDLKLAQLEKLIDLKKITESGEKISSSVVFLILSSVFIVFGYINFISILPGILLKGDFDAGDFMLAYILFFIGAICAIISLFDLFRAGKKLQKIIR